ncbi:MAG: DinB family protein [bacterium]|nr:DinB family protein [bacterium]
MSEVSRIADQLMRAQAGDAWHGPSLAELLADVTAAEASARPVAGAHTIWENVLHVTVWADVVRRRLGGEKIGGDLPAAEDWPAQGEGGEAWEAARRGLEAAHRALGEAILGLDEKRVEEHEVAMNLYGVVQHGLYHAGQIALLRKA